VRSSPRYDELLDPDVIATLAQRRFASLRLDEVHRVKQRPGRGQPQRRLAIEQLRRAAHAAIALTSIPSVNELAESLSLAQLLNNHAPQFQATSLSGRRLADVADMFEALIPHLIRHTKQTMLRDLPAYHLTITPVPLPSELHEDLVAIHARPKARAMEALIALRKLAVNPAVQL
jgi:hypothetical protein